MRRTRHTETRALGAFALACYAATLAATFSVGYALVALALKVIQLRHLVASARGGF